MRDSGKRLVNEITGVIHEWLRGKSDSQIRLIRKRLRSLTTTNCGWDAYVLRDGLDQIAAEYLHTRSYLNRKREKGSK